MVTIIRDIQQGTDEWLRLRLGRMTASHAQAIATQGKGLDTLCRHIAGQLFTQMIDPDGFKNDNMQRGNDEEDFARTAYELTEGVNVEQVGFGLYNDFVGASPDGLVGLDGGVEFKRKTFSKHNDILISGGEEFETGYIWQCHMNMLVFDRQWWDLCSFNPHFGNRSLFKYAIGRDALKDEQLLAGFAEGEKLIKKYLEILKK